MKNHVSHRAFLGVSTLLFAASAAVTIVWCSSMSSMGEMSMPGGWTMSMAWMRMPDQTWLSAAATFIGMWGTMMIAMMLPSLVPMLARYRIAVGTTTQGRRAWLTVLVGVGYFSVWTALGVVAFPVGATVAAMEMQWPALAEAVPLMVGVVVVLAGVLQFTAWKARQLACCRPLDCRRSLTSCGRRTLRADDAMAYGFRLGLRCVYCCAGSTAILLVGGVMDLRAMAAVTAAITVERLAPNGGRVARGVGAILVATGLLLIVRASNLP
jgi:predicted metal-binding membrane protein